MWERIGGYIWHYLVIIWPYFLVIGSLALSYIEVFYIGRWIERHQWRKEIKDGKRLGELVQEQLKKRDNRIGKLTKEITELESKIEQVGIKHRRLIGLSQEIINVAVSEDAETLRRRRRA